MAYAHLWALFKLLQTKEAQHKTVPWQSTALIQQGKDMFNLKLTSILTKVNVTADLRKVKQKLK